MSRRRMVAVIEDPARRLLETCRHRAPACLSCVADDMEAQRDRAEASLRNVRMLAAMAQARGHFKPGDAEHFLRYCAEAGVKSSIVRASPSTAKPGARDGEGTR